MFGNIPIGKARMAQTKVLVIDDEVIIGSLVSNALNARGYEVKTAKSAAECRPLAETFAPEVFIIDIELGKGTNGIDLAHVLSQTNPDAGIIFLTNIPEPRVIGLDNKAIPKSAGYVYKKNLTDIGQLVYAIEIVRRKGSIKSIRDDKNMSHDFASVSNSQLHVLHLIALGYSNNEIAQERGTTVRAVENLINRACEAAGIAPGSGTNLRVNAARRFIQVAGLPQE